MLMKLIITKHNVCSFEFILDNSTIIQSFNRKVDTNFHHTCMLTF